MLDLLSSKAQADLIRLIDARIVEQVGTATEPQHTPASPWLTVAEAAQHLRTTPAAIYKRIKRGQLSSYRPEGSPILLRREDLTSTGPQKHEVL